MWLTSSSIGRKLVMAVTGLCLVLFVTFHCIMNAVAICCPDAYDQVCELLGANWYALVASAGLAALMIIHIIYAVWLTVQNRKARGNDRYEVVRKPAQVEWASQNMLVLGIVILAFLVVHLIQFWAKMQLAELTGSDYTADGVTYNPAQGTAFLGLAFKQPWTLIVYVIGFVALWFHMSHGFWSMFQSAGWNGDTWLPRLKCIGNIWVTVVCGLFLAEGIVFTVQAHRGAYDVTPVEVEMVCEQAEMVVADCPMAECDQAACPKADCDKAECPKADCDKAECTKAECEKAECPNK